MSKEFHFKLMFTVNEDHPLYELPDREIVAELTIFLMDGMSRDPFLGYDCEVIR